MENKNLWLVSEIKISYHNDLQLGDRLTVTCSKDAEIIFRNNWSDSMELLEEFNVMFLTRASQVIGLFRVSRGGIWGTVVDPKILFAAALKSVASAVILGHNHPSGNVEPSPKDVTLTEKLCKCGELLEISVLDHIILGKDDYYSFADEGRL